jgi:hypothetical protein
MCQLYHRQEACTDPYAQWRPRIASKAAAKHTLRHTMGPVGPEDISHKFTTSRRSRKKTEPSQHNQLESHIHNKTPTCASAPQQTCAHHQPSVGAPCAGARAAQHSVRPGELLSPLLLPYCRQQGVLQVLLDGLVARQPKHGHRWDPWTSHALWQRRRCHVRPRGARAQPWG